VQTAQPNPRTSSMIVVDGPEGPMPAQLNLPARPNGCGLVLGMSLWGLNADIGEWAAYMADVGYAVITPNLFWRTAPDHAIDYDMSRMGELAPFMDSAGDAQAVRDLVQAADGLRRVAGCERIGVVGWCYGGRIACLAGANDAFSAVVAYYPTVLETRLDAAGTVVGPLCLHLAGVEQYATREDAAELIVAAFASSPGDAAHVYPGAMHGFAFAPPHPHHDPYATRLADTRTALFLDQALVRHGD
jgi:carboxymethylenebutenolidase